MTTVRHSLALVWMSAYIASAQAQALTQQQEFMLGKSASWYVGGTYLMELAVTGECATPNIVKRPNHRKAVDAVIAGAPPAMQAEFRQALSPAELSKVLAEFEEMRAQLKQTSKEVQVGREFGCGMLFGVGATTRSMGMKQWKQVLGKELPA